MDYQKRERRINYLRKQNTRLSKVISNELQKDL